MTETTKDKTERLGNFVADNINEKEPKMTISLSTPPPPPFLKIGFFGGTGSGKTYTAAKVLSQFIAEYAKGKQLAMFDTEPSAGYIAPMVQKITGKPLLALTSRSFSQLLEFCELVRREGHVALVDSITHPWRSLCDDFLEAKRSRVAAVGGRPDSVRLTIKDWSAIKPLWGKFTEHYIFDPIHWCMNGREGDVWEDVVDDEGETEMKKTGEKMKTENETGYEPSLLVRMKLTGNQHTAEVRKDRFDVLTGHISYDKPDIEFFRPHIAMLGLGGKAVSLAPGAKPAVEPGHGKNWETIKAERDGLLENIKDDIVLAFPGQTAADKTKKIELLRAAFKTSSWTEMESDAKAFPASVLRAGRLVLQDLIGKAK